MIRASQPGLYTRGAHQLPLGSDGVWSVLVWAGKVRHVCHEYFDCITSLMRYRSRVARSIIVLSVGLLCLSLSDLHAQVQINVTTQHGDSGRTGQNTQETILTQANVNSTNFGKLFSVPVDGYIYAQPLYLTNVNVASVIHNVVYVATEHDSVYAIDADNGAILWQVSFINPSAGITTVSNIDVNCGDLVPEIGITGTPVIDSTSGTIYVVAKTKENGAVLQRLHALDVTSGAEKPGSPVVITASVPGTGDGSSMGVINFDPLREHNRPGLLLQNGHVIMGWASHCDNGPYHGWIMSYNSSTLAQEAVWNSTPNGGLGGVWMSGAGLSGDSSFNTYFATVNGTYNGNSDFGDTIMKLGPPNNGALPVSDWFTPYNQSSLSQYDTDVGSGGVLLVPDQPAGSPHQHLLIQAGKEGTIYLVDRDNMGRFNPSSNNQIVQSLPGALTGMWGLPAWWNNNLYVVGTGDVGQGVGPLETFAFNPTTGLFDTSPISQSSINFSFPSPSPSVSANGTTNAIVWLIQVNQYNGTAPAVLRAYDATNLASELYDSQQNATRDAAGLAVKFTAPVIANGRVYVGTQSQLSVYGVLSRAPVITSANNVTFTTGASNTFTVTASGFPTPALSESGALPSGITF